MNKVAEQVLYTMAVDIDNKWVDKLGFVRFAINSVQWMHLPLRSWLEIIYSSNV